MLIRAKQSAVASKWKNHQFFTFFDELFSACKFWETFITRNARTWGWRSPRAGKDLRQEEQVHSGVVEHVLVARGRLGAGEELRRQESTWIDFSFQADWLIFNTNFCARFKLTQSTQNMSKEGWEVKVDKFLAGLVLNVGRRWNFLSISSRQKSSEKVKKRASAQNAKKRPRFLYFEATADFFARINIFHLPT
jgi:hypothetical protein